MTEAGATIDRRWYRERLPAAADSASAPDLVLLHGWGMSAAVWRHWLPLLRRRCNVILLDLPGFGRSPAQPELTVDQLCDQLREYVPQDAALLGWSLGGNLALAFDERFPGHCRALFTLACNPSFIAHGDWLPGMPADMFRQFQCDLAEHPERTLRRFLGLQARGSDGERQLARWLRDLIGDADCANPQALQWGLRILAQLDTRAALQNCKLPGVHIYGSADVLVPPAVARAVGVLNPEHWVVLLDRAAHLPFVSHAELCWQHLDRLLASARLLQRPRAHLRTKQAVAASFSRAAATYDSAAELQRAVAGNLLAGFAAPDGGSVLDLGCGTGAATALLAGRYRVVALDLAEGMLRFARAALPTAATPLPQMLPTTVSAASAVVSRAATAADALAGAAIHAAIDATVDTSTHAVIDATTDTSMHVAIDVPAEAPTDARVDPPVEMAPTVAGGLSSEVAPAISTGAVHWLCGDAENLPLADESFDAVFSSLAVQWCENLGAVFTELQRVLRPGGSAWLSTLGPATLHELRSAWAAVDDRVHVNQFMDLPAVLDAVQRTGLVLTACHESAVVMRYAELRQLTRELKALGAHNVNRGRPAGLLARRQLQRFSAAYEAQRLDDGNLPATYQVYYLQLTKPQLTE